MPSKPLRSTRGSGSIRQRSKGSWQIRYDGPPDENGKVRKLSETFRGSKPEAEKRKRELLGLIDSGDYVDKSEETVARFLKNWLETYAATNTTLRTQQGYRGLINRYIGPRIGNLALQGLQAGHIQRLYSDMLERGLSARTVLHTHRVIRQSLGHAVKWGLLSRNVADATTPPRPERKEIKTWDIETTQAFLELVEGSRYGDFYHMAILTGMRRSELCGLKWEAVDFDNARITVVRTLQLIYHRGLVEGTPKTDRSRRSIAVNPSALEVLRRIRTAQFEQRLSVGAAWQEQSFVFTRPDGRPLMPDDVTKDFHDIVKDSGLPHITLHGLRHVHATMLLSKGIHAKIVSERLGHSNIGITMDTYSHVLPGMQEVAAAAMEEALGQANPRR